MQELKSKLLYSVAFYLGLGLLAAAILASRKPDSILRPQFFAEDGFLWYADAYNKGIGVSLIEPAAGYFQSVARIIATFSLLLPLKLAPLFFTLSAILVQVSPLFVLFSSRFATIVPKSKTKVFLLFSYLLLFNSQETFINVTNAQWYLAILSFMLLVSDESELAFWRIVDLVIIIISGLSGPFSIFMYPFAVITAKIKNTQHARNIVAAVSVTATLQLLSVFSQGRGLVTTIAGEDLKQLILHIFFIFHRQIVWGLLIGPVGYDFVSRFFLIHLVMIGITCILIFLVSYMVLRVGYQLKLFIAFSAVLFVCGLWVPTIVVPAGMTSWQVLLNASGIRYWLLPMLCLLCVLVFSSGHTRVVYIRYLSRSLLLIMVLSWLVEYGFGRNYRLPGYEDFHFSQQVDEFEKQPTGTKFVFRHPPRPWTMTLNKK